MTPRTVQQLFDLKGKTALVTGGSRGLGLQMAHALGEAGARIMLSSRKAGDLETGRGRPAGRRHRRALDRRRLRGGGRHPPPGRRDPGAHGRRWTSWSTTPAPPGARPAEDHPVEAWDKVMNLNVRGYFILSQHIAKHSMIPRQAGRIINIASIAGLGGNPPEMQTIAYNTSKGAVINFTRALAAEWGTLQHHRQRHLPGLLPEQDDHGHAQGAGRGKARRHTRRCAAWATTKTSRA